MTNSTFETDFAIVGAGVAGLWLSTELLRRGSRVLLIDYRLIGKFASSRHQGWLHSGSMYAVLGGSTLPGGVAQVCLTSNGRLREFCREHCPSAILESEGALFLFDHERDAEDAASNVEKLGVPMSWLTLKQIRGHESRLAPSFSPFGFLTQIDCAFVATPILNALVRINERRGSIVVASACPLPELKVDRQSCGWVVSDGVVTVSALSVVLCAGAVNPLLLGRITGRDVSMKIQRSFVGVFHAPITRGIVRVDTGDSPVMFCPFPGGTTVNIQESEIASHLEPELQFDDNRGENDNIKEFEGKLSRVLRLAGVERFHFYSCEKLNNTNDHRNPYPLSKHLSRHYFWTDEGDKLYSFYPGKFMAVPVACEDLASKLIAIPSVGRSYEARPAPLSVPELPMYGAPTHVVVSSDDRIKISRYDKKRV